MRMAVIAGYIERQERKFLFALFERNFDRREGCQRFVPLNPDLAQ